MSGFVFSKGGGGATISTGSVIGVDITWKCAVSEDCTRCLSFLFFGFAFFFIFLLSCTLGRSRRSLSPEILFQGCFAMRVFCLVAKF